MSATSIPLPFTHSDGLSRVSRQIAVAVRSKSDLAVLLVHVHDVERLCASLGHMRVGQVLAEFHNELRAISRDNDAIERISECKFAVLLNGLRNRGHVSLAAQKINRVARKMEIGDTDQSALNTTVGVVLCPEQGDDPHELLRSAEIATLDGRRKNDSVCFYEESSADQLFTDWGLEARLANALVAGNLDLHYQPKISLRTNEIVGAEALMRWSEPEIGSISPDVFIDVAEKTGQIFDLTHFAIQRACRQLSEWQGLLPNLGIAVNITPSIIQNLEIVDVLQNAVSIWGTKPEFLTMEVTENALMADPRTSHDILTRIREFGAQVSIDDFGTGYSSLAYLKDIPADELKIDRSFVMGMMTDSGDHKIVVHSIQIAKSFGLTVVAEGIDSLETLNELRRLGCDFAQGFFVCKPIPAGVFESFCRDFEGIADA
jgi:diguanylate cyclase (GGDEF)-like protein